MTLIPFILDLADELNEFSRGKVTTTGMDIDDFGFGIYPSEQHHYQHHSLLSSQRRARLAAPLYWVPGSLRQRHHPYNRHAKTACCNKTVLELEKELTEKESAPVNLPANVAAAKSAYSVVNKNGFQVSMNVKQFAPDELTVKTIDNCIVVEGQHDDKEDGHGVISRHFIRKYMLPKGYDPNQVLSTLSSDGILTVKAPPPPPPPPAVKNADEHIVRVIDVQQTNGGIAVGTAQQLLPVKDAQTPASREQQQTIVAVTVAAATAAKEQQLKTNSAAAAIDMQNANSAAVEERNGKADHAVGISMLQPEENKSQILENVNGKSVAAVAVTETVQQNEPEKIVINELKAKEIATVVGSATKPVPVAVNEDDNGNVKIGALAGAKISIVGDVEMPDADTTTATTGSTTSKTGLVDGSGIKSPAKANEDASLKVGGGELLAAADAAILLCKTLDCENNRGAANNSTPAAKEVAN